MTFGFTLGILPAKAGVMLQQYNQAAEKQYEDNETLTTHTIIAFDNALGINNIYLKNRNIVVAAIDKAIKRLHVRENEKSFFSLVNFGLATGNSNINSMVRVIKDKRGKNLEWKNIQHIDSILYYESWEDMVVRQGMNYLVRNGAPFSLQTGAKAFSLKTVRPVEREYVANRTYLLMVTDDKYNGNDDVNKEINSFNNPYINKTEFIRSCYEVSDNYSFRYKTKFGIAGDYGVYVYEVVPSQSVSLSSVVNFPSNLGIRRVNGGYEINTKFESIDSHYKIVRIKVTAESMNGKSLTAETFGEAYQGEIEKGNKNIDGKLRLKLPKGKYSEKVNIVLEGELFLNDSIYDGMKLSGEDSNFKRLKMSYQLPLVNEAKVLGILPLPDVLWIFTNNVDIAMAVWNVLALLLIIFVVLGIGYVYVKRKTTYRPTIDDIKIKLTR